MFYERLIAKRFLRRDKNNFSRPLINIATCTISLGVVVMIMSVSILRGFQKEITYKVVGFGSHISIRSYGTVNDYDEVSIALDSSEINKLAAIPGVSNISAYAYKGGMLKTEEQIQGVIFKGIDNRFDSSFFAKNMVRGRLMVLNDTATVNEIIISQRMASKMGLDTGMKARTYFWSGDNYRARAFSIVGIYNTDLSEFDDHYIIGDIKQIQRLNEWGNDLVGGYEIIVDNFDQVDAILRNVKGATPPELAVTSIKEEQPSMFAWLELLNSNIVLILVIMAIVCAASVISALLIMIFEKTSMIGLLKTMGSTNSSIRKIFMLKAAGIIGKGIVIGNAVAFLLSIIQTTFHIIKLDSESYSMPFVPVDINLWYYIAISAGTLLVCTLALLLPSTYIAHIDPAKTVRVE